MEHTKTSIAAFWTFAAWLAFGGVASAQTPQPTPEQITYQISDHLAIIDCDLDDQSRWFVESVNQSRVSAGMNPVEVGYASPQPERERIVTASGHVIFITSGAAEGFQQTNILLGDGFSVSPTANVGTFLAHESGEGHVGANGVADPETTHVTLQLNEEQVGQEFAAHDATDGRSDDLGGYVMDVQNPLGSTRIRTVNVPDASAWRFRVVSTSLEDNTDTYDSNGLSNSNLREPFSSIPVCVAQGSPHARYSVADYDSYRASGFAGTNYINGNPVNPFRGDEFVSPTWLSTPVATTQAPPRWEGSAIGEPVTLVRPKCNGRTATIWGTDGADLLNGTPGNDVIVGLKGDDIINGGGGDDIICAGGGADTVDAGAGNDTVFGGWGKDTIDGGSGDDTLRGEESGDTLIGGFGNDTLYGNAGPDELVGGAGNDTLLGGYGRDTLKGQDGVDRLEGGRHADTLNGGNQDDELFGGKGHDIVNGNYGNDIVRGGNGDDTLSGGFGNDDVRGGAGNDTISGDSGVDSLFGGDGDDGIESDPADSNRVGGAGVTTSF